MGTKLMGKERNLKKQTEIWGFWTSFSDKERTKGGCE